MKKALKFLLKPLWQVGAPFRRVFMHKVEYHLLRMLGPFFQRLAQSVAESRDAVTRELDGVARELDDVTRELARLQVQVEFLHQTVPLTEPLPEDPEGEALRWSKSA